MKIKQTHFMIGLGFIGLYGAYLLSSSMSGSLLGSLFGKNIEHYDGTVRNAVRDVRIQSKKEISWSDVTNQAGLNFGDQVFVGNQSSAEVQIGGMGLKLSENSLFEIEKKQQSSELRLAYGKMNLSMQNAQSVDVKIGNEKIQIDGGGSEISINRSKDSKSENLGISSLNGNATIKTAGGEKIEAKQNGFLMLSVKPGQKLSVERYNLALDKMVQRYYLQKHKVKFSGTIDPQLQEAYLEVAADPKFERVVQTKAMSSGHSSVELESAEEPGKYYWRLRAKTTTGLEMETSPESFYVVELKPVKVFNPFYKFQRPGVWSAEVILENIDQVEKYQVQASRKSDFSEIYLDNLSESSRVRLDFMQSGDYFIRARYRLPKLTEVPHWSEIVPVKIPLPLVLHIKNPRYQFVKPGLWSVELQVDDIDKAERYELQISKKVDFSEIVQTVSSRTASFKFETTENGLLFIRARYYFKASMTQPEWSEPLQTKIAAPLSRLKVRKLESGKIEQVRLGWADRIQFAKYQIRVADNDKFDNARVFFHNSDSINIDAKVNQFQYLQVSGYMNDGQYSEWSDSFLIPALLEKIKISKAEIYPKRTPRFDSEPKDFMKASWMPLVLLDSKDDFDYQVELADNSSMNKPVTKLLKGSEVVFDLREIKPMHFRIRPVVDGKRYISQVSEFLEIRPPVIPRLGVFQMTVPRDKEMMLMSLKQNDPIEFQWTKSASALGYEIQIASDKNFEKVLFKKTLEENHIQFSEQLPKGSYFWRVKSYHYWADSDWSKYREFKVIYEQSR